MPKKKYENLYDKSFYNYFKRVPDKYNKKIKELVLTHYGQGKLACLFCGEERLDCLSLDHINNDGWKDRSKGHAGVRLYTKLYKEKFPLGYQTLCMNCQFLKEMNYRRNKRL